MLALDRFNLFRFRRPLLHAPPETTKRIVCLANSRKESGRCIAGKVIDGSAYGQWIRPVSETGWGLSKHERLYPDNTEPRVLDLIDINLKRAVPDAHQTENWSVNSSTRWSSAGLMKWTELFRLEDHPTTLWHNGSSTYHGLNDRVSLADCRELHCSLYLLHLYRMKLRVLTPGLAYGEPARRVQGAFRYRGINYRMWVTDPTVEQFNSSRPDGLYGIGECFVTISLGEPFLGYCYKLLAAVITPQSNSVETCLSSESEGVSD
jgi:hypothetical protein